MKYLLTHPITATIGTEKYKCTITWRNGEFISDEAESIGGKDLGPDPYTLLLSALATCTLATLRMYIDRKGWDVADIAVSLNMYQETKEGRNITIIDRDLTFLTAVTDEQRERLLQIARVCPISKMLEGEIQVHTLPFNDNRAAISV